MPRAHEAIVHVGAVAVRGGVGGGVGILGGVAEAEAEGGEGERMMNEMEAMRQARAEALESSLHKEDQVRQRVFCEGFDAGYRAALDRVKAETECADE
jgi:hypothetical protein